MQVQSDGTIILTRTGTLFGLKEGKTTCNPLDGVCQSKSEINLCPLHGGRINFYSKINHNPNKFYYNITTPNPELLSGGWSWTFSKIEKKTRDTQETVLTQGTQGETEQEGTEEDYWQVHAIYDNCVKKINLDSTIITNKELQKFLYSFNLFVGNGRKNIYTKNYITNKIPSLFVCQDRPLKSGEKPKRRGQSTVYEAIDKLNPSLIEKLFNSKYKFNITIKHDGQCSLITTHLDNGNSNQKLVKIYRRYDIRKGKNPPEGSILGGKNKEGQVEFCWIDVTDSTDPGDQYYQSALERNEEGAIMGIWCIIPFNGSFKKDLIPLENFDIYHTFELVGPKIQSNPYKFPLTENTSIKIGDTYKQVPKNYFIKHGDFSIVDDLKLIDLNLKFLRNYLIQNNYEGLVIHFDDGEMYKVNRFHVGAQNPGKEEFNII